MTRRVVVFGTGAFAEVVDFYLAHDSDARVVAFTATGDAAAAGSAFGRPLVPWDEVARQYPPDDHELFIAVGYAKLNSLRERFCAEGRARGYRLLTYVSSRATTWGDTVIGDNVFVFEDNTIQPFVRIGDGTVLWSGNHIGHHSRIGAYCFITSHVVVSGNCNVGDRCFIGVNATIGDGVTIGEDTLIAAGAILTKDAEAGGAYLPQRTDRHHRAGPDFFK